MFKWHIFLCLMFSNNELAAWVTNLVHSLYPIYSRAIPEAGNPPPPKFINSTNINWVPGNLLVHELEGDEILFRSYTRTGSQCFGHVFPKCPSSDPEQTILYDLLYESVRASYAFRRPPFAVLVKSLLAFTSKDLSFYIVVTPSLVKSFLCL